MYTIRRILRPCLALLAVVAFLAACTPVAPPAGTAGTAPASADTPVTITVAAQSGHTAATAAKDKLAEFEAATGIQVELVEIPEQDLTQKLLLEFSGQTGR